MKVNSLTGQPAICAYKTQSIMPRSNKLHPSADQISLSPEALALSAAISKLKEHMDIRGPEEAARIEEIAKQIRNGSYQVPGDKVAAKIVDEYLGLQSR
jgi:flagellar biosynthesis anti-sigma factor FlgM